MSWTTTPVQTKTASGATSPATVTLDSNPAVGNLLVVGAVTSNELGPVNDGWVLDATNGFRADFAWLGFYYRVVASGDDLAALKTFSRPQTASDQWALTIAELTGTGPWTSATVLDKSQANKPSVDGTTISTGTTASLDQPDGLAVAVVGFSRTLSGTGTTVTGFSNSFTEILEKGTTSGDAPDISMAVKDVGNTTAGVETTATLSASERRPIGLIFVFKTDPPVTVKVRLTGGAANSDPAASLGGAKSTVEAGTGFFHDVSRLQADATGGHTDYRVGALHNIVNLRGLSAAVKVYIDTQPAVGSLDIAVPSESAGVNVSALANESTAPSGPTFSRPSTSGAALDFGTIGPDSFRGIHFKRTIPENAAATTLDHGHITIVATPL